MKTFITFSLLLLSISISAQISTDGLIACYNFDENANDEINAFNGTIMGNCTTNGSINMGGNAEDALSIPGTILNNVTEYTIAHKILFTDFNVNHQSSSNVIFSGASSANDNLMNFAYAKDQLPGGSATLQNTIFYIHNNVRYEFNNIDLNINTWYHFTLVRSTNRLKFYLDGIEQIPLGGISVPTLNLSLESNGFIFGQDQDILAGGFQDFQSLNGSLDDLLIYDRELNDQEVLDISEFNHSTLLVNESQLSNSISIYPNPVGDILKIKNYKYENSVVDISLFDLTGKKVNLTNRNDGNLDVSYLSSGSYILIITNNSGKIQKFKINKI